MSRFTRTSLTAVVLLFVGGGVWWLFLNDAPETRSRPLTALHDSVSIRWTEDGVASIDAGGELDALRGLGYVHGRNRGWTITLWRQTARGRLGRWFGTGVLAIDRHARKLGLAHQARAAYDRLSSSEQRRLRAYTQGLNAALQSEVVRGQDAFVLLDVEPAPWKPWHTLAIERLLAWLGTSPPPLLKDAPASVTNFKKQDQKLRRWLHLHGWHRSVAWAVRSGAESGAPTTVLFQRHVLGATASPVLQEVVLNRRGAAPLVGATLPGVPLIPTGSQDDRAWASLLRSTAQLQYVPFDSTRLNQRYERLSPANGDERLVHRRQLDRALLLDRSTKNAPGSTETERRYRQADGTDPPQDEMAWVVRWPGFTATSDVPAWLRRAGFSETGDTTGFELFTADGLTVSSDGQWTIRGTPSVVVHDSAERVVVGNTEWARSQAQALRANHRSKAPIAVRNWSASDSSTWATRLFPHLTPAVNRLERTRPELQNVAAYLRNWDKTYTPSSIGATIFDQWMRAYRAELGDLPHPREPTPYFSTYRQHQSLLQALDTLQAQFGPDVRQWRWERAVPDRRFFPVWSADSLVQDNLRELSTTQYAPLVRRGQGHPSALSGGPSLVDPPPTASSPTAWEGWTSPSAPLTVRRHHYDPTETFARSRIRRDRPTPIRLPPDSMSSKTVLVPASD